MITEQQFIVPERSGMKEGTRKGMWIFLRGGNGTDFMGGLGGR